MSDVSRSAATALDPEAAAALEAPYQPGFGCSPREPLQRALDALYDYARDPETQVLHRSRLNRFDAVLSELESRGALAARRRALDLGCNAGYYSKMISDRGYADVLGIDVEREYIARANRHFASVVPGRVRRFEVGDAEQLGAPAEFDFILCTEVIEHTGRPERVIAGIAAALAPGGLAVVTLPNRRSPAYAWARAVHALRRRPHDPVLHDHLQWPSSRARRLFEPLGLERRGTTGTNLVLLGPVIRALHRAPGFAALHRADYEVSAWPPLHRFAQFYFTVWMKPARSARRS